MIQCSMAIAAPPSPELLDRYYTRVLGLAYQVLGDAALATRAAETTFERLLRAERHDTVDVWRTAVDVLRSYLVRGLTVEPLASQAAGWQAALIDGLAELEPEARMLLVLRYHEGLAHEQMAEVLGTDPAQAREGVARARNTLMDVLGLRDAMR